MSNIQDYFVIEILTYVATRLIQHQYTPHKRVIVAQLELNKRTVYVPVVHLTSDRQESCSTKRAHQLNVVFDRTCPAIGDDAGTLSLLLPFALAARTHARSLGWPRLWNGLFPVWRLQLWR